MGLCTADNSQKPEQPLQQSIRDKAGCFITDGLIVVGLITLLPTLFRWLASTAGRPG